MQDQGNITVFLKFYSWSVKHVMVWRYATAQLDCRQHLVHLLHYRAPGSSVALAWLHHNLLAHPDGRLPERNVREGSPHSTSSHLQLQLHTANEALFPGTEVPLLKGGATLLHNKAWQLAALAFLAFTMLPLQAQVDTCNPLFVCVKFTVSSTTVKVAHTS